MKNLWITSLLLLTLFVPSQALAQYDLIYDPGTGSLTIDTKGGPIAGYVLEFLPSQNVFAGPFVVVPGANIIDLTVNANQIPLFAPGQSNRTGFAYYLSEIKQTLGVGIPDPTGVIPIGDVVLPGLTEQQYLDTFSNTTSQWQYVAGEGNGVVGDFNLVYVPEPTSLALFGLGGLLVRRARRVG
jgi:hypothetical protein